MRSPDPLGANQSLAGSRDADLNTTRGGRISASLIDADSRVPPAFVHIAPKSIPLPVLIAVPHAGRTYPAEVLEQLRDAQHAQLRLEDRHVDVVGVEIAKATGTGLLVAHAPRAMVDLNRAHDDVDWDMVAEPSTGPLGQSRRRAAKPKARPSGANARARSGLGLIPRRLPGYGEIWRQRVAREELDRRIDEIHRPYHTFLARELERIRDAWGAALLIDLHSMPPLRRQKSAETDEEAPPQVVLGDRFGASCHSALISRAFSYLDAQGCVSAHNRPYSGGYVLDRHASPQRGIHAIQIELCRSTYLDPSLSSPTPAAKPLAKMLAGLIRELGAEAAGLGAAGDMAQAAE